MAQEENNVTKLPVKKEDPKKPVRRRAGGQRKKAAPVAPKTPAKKSVLPPPNLYIAGLIGGVMPIFSVLFSSGAGHFWVEGAYVPAGLLGFAGLMGLAVSLSHVAEAIAYATGTNFWASLALAIAFELGIVGLEIGRTVTPGAFSLWIGWAMTVGLAVLVACLNVYAFRLHAFRVLDKSSSRA